MNNWIFGRHSVLEALKRERNLEEILIAKASDGILIDEIIKLASRQKKSVQMVDIELISSKAGGGNHQGVVARMGTSAFSYADVDDIFSLAESRGHPPLIALLDGITDTHNLGAIVRSAECAGFDGVVIAKHGSAEVNSTVIKTSAGAIWHLPVAQVTNLAMTMKDMKKRNVWIYGMDVQSDRTIYDIDASSGVAVVIGSEGSGMRRLIKENCDFLVKIPQMGQIGSLNASVSAGVVFFEVLRKRQGLA